MIKLRPYKNKDVFALVDMLGMLKDTSLKNIFVADEVAGGGGGEPDYERVGALIMDVLFECWSKCGDAMINWLADLNGMTREEFDNADECVLDTIETIVDRAESKDFFSRAYRLFKRIGGSPTRTESE